MLTFCFAKFTSPLATGMGLFQMKKELNLRGKVRIEALINKEDTEKYLETKDISLCLHARNKLNSN